MTGGIATVSDRAISSLAIVKVNFDRRHSFLENFAPFLRHCMAASDHDALSAPHLQEQIREEFGLQLPQAVIKTMLRREERAGRVKRAGQTFEADREKLDDADLEADRADAQRKQSALIGSIIDFAEENFSVIWSVERAQRLLMEYLDAFSTTVLAAAVAGKPVFSRRHAWVGDQYVVHKFVLHASREMPDSFAFLEVVVKGKMLADAVYLGQIDDQRSAKPLKRLDVYLDGPILLHLLGYGGPEMAAPYVELVELLKEQGANVRCFTESVEEARGILDVAAEKAWTGNYQQRFYGDVVAHLLRAGKSRSDIQLLAERLKNDLLAIGVQPVDQPPPDPRLTTDESRFQQMLEEVGYKNKNAITTDLDALTAIHRLRKGRNAKTLAKSKAVFVTRNSDLVRVSATFFHQRQVTAVPNCVHDGAFTTMVWLNEPLAAPTLPRDRIIADAFAAMNPSDRLWRAFIEEIERLQETENISEDDAHILRLAEESKQALMDETLGDDDAYTEGTALQVLERARESMEEDLQQKLEKEREERRAVERVLRRRREATQARALRIGLRMARAIFAVVIPVLSAGLLFGPLGPFAGGWSPLPDAVQVLCTIAVLAFTAWSFWEGVSLRSLARRTAQLAAKAVEALLERLTRAEA